MNLKKNNTPGYATDAYFIKMLEESIKGSTNNAIELGRNTEKMISLENNAKEVKEALNTLGGRMDDKFDSLIHEMRDTFVTNDKHAILKTEVNNTKKIIWWGMGILSAVIIAVISMLFRTILQ